MAKWKGFAGPSYTAMSKIAAYDRSVNLFCERIESGTGNDNAQYVMYQAPGYLELSSASSSVELPGRGGWTMLDFGAYYIVGGTLYRLGGPAVATGISNIDNSPVYFTSNGDTGRQLLIGSDDTSYSYDLDSEVLTNVGTQTDVSVGFIDGYGIRLDVARSEISVSAPFDFTSWDPLDVSQRNDAPDKWQRLLVHHKELWLFGSDTSSVWYNAGDEGVAGPFAPIQSVFIPYGIVARNTAVVADGSPIWLGGTPNGSCIVYKAEGYTPVRISTYAVENAIREIFQRALTVQNAEASTYQENSHIFYVLTFPPNADTGFPGSTWVYDTTSGLWHERGVWNGLEYGCIDTRGDVQSNIQFTMSRSSGKIYLQSIGLFVGTDGTGIRWMRRAPHLSSENKGTIIDRVEVKFQPGMALSTGAGSDPQVSLRWSNNGGQTWSNTHTRSMGLIGEYDVRAEWLNLGFGRDRLIEVTGSNPIFSPIIDAFVDARTGRS